MDKIDLVVKRIEDLKDSTDNKLDALKEGTEKRLDYYNDLLKDHIKRTNILESLHQDNQARIEMLEEPVKAKKYINGLIVKIGGLAVAIFSVIKLLQHFDI